MAALIFVVFILRFSVDIVYVEYIESIEGTNPLTDNIIFLQDSLTFANAMLFYVGALFLLIIKSKVKREGINYKSTFHIKFLSFIFNAGLLVVLLMGLTSDNKYLFMGTLLSIIPFIVIPIANKLNAETI